ncbi:MAG: ATP-binding protein [Nitrospirae bacterium]|nr:ATP-binding protein [Nitrospirota bacterium]
MIDRAIEPVLKALSRQYPVITITGPRQSGKTTLCRKVFPKKAYINLEAIDTRKFATEDPRGFLSRYPDGAILDEIQRAPELVSYIQVLVDEQKKTGQFILTGSQQFEVIMNITQSLAGRTALLKLLPFCIEEIRGISEIPSIDNLLLKGFYPRIYDMKLNPTQALGDYLETYVERDLRQIINIRDLGLFQKFLKLCAGRIGQILNMHNLANEVGVSHTTVRSWITILEASYIIFLLRPYFRNISKRLVKSPKLYFHDVGLASYLLRIENTKQMSRDPLRGNLFENMAVVEALKYRANSGRRSNLSFYRDSTGNEIDMIYETGPDVFPVEIKAGATITNDYFKGLKNFAKVHPHLPWGGGLIYGGAEVQIRSGYKIYPSTKVYEMLKSVENGG